MLPQIKAPQFYTDLGLKKTLLNPPVNGKFQGLFKAFVCFSSTVQGKFYLFSRTFQDSLVYSSTFQACANPVLFTDRGDDTWMDRPQAGGYIPKSSSGQGIKRTPCLIEILK